MHRALTTASLTLIAFALATVARAGDDKLAWNLSDDLHRVDLVEDAAVSSATWFDGAPDAARLLRPSDFDKAKRPSFEVATTGDVLWWLALALPDDPGPKGGSPALRHSFKLGALGDVEARGKEEIAHENGVTKLELKATLVPLKPPASGNRLRDGSTIALERTFDEKKGVVTETRFELVLETQSDAGAATERHSGKITFHGKVELGSKSFLEKVDDAIKRGKASLASELKREIAGHKNESPPRGEYALGRVAIMVFALLRSGATVDELKDAFAFMEKCEWTEVYSVSLYIMCLEAKSIRRKAVPPVEGGHTVARFSREPAAEKDKKEMSRAAAWLIAARKAGSWTYGNGEGGTGARRPRMSGGDRSNTQFAALAIHCAAMSGCPIEPEVFAEIAEELALAQEQIGPDQRLKDVVWTPAAPVGIGPEQAPTAPLDGKTHTKQKPTTTPVNFDLGTRARGWGYFVRTPCQAGTAYGSMTGAGLSSAALAREGLRRANKLSPDLESKTRRSIYDGLAWFLIHWTPSQAAYADSGGRRTRASWFYYYLYSVEKAMEMVGVESFGGHDWWREGCAQLLVLEDKPKAGTWGEQSSDTALALLFLNRATLPARLVVVDRVRVATGKSDDQPWDEVKIEGVGFVRLEQVLEALETATGIDARDDAKIAEKGFEVLSDELRPRLVPGLVRLLAANDKEARRSGQKLLKLATGGIDDAEKARAFTERFSELERAGLARDYAAIPKARAALAAADSTLPLKRGALLALARLRAVEALGEIIAELANKDAGYRRQVSSVAIDLAGGEKSPFDPAGKDADRAKQIADWRTWWDANKEELSAAENARRSVEQLASADAKIAADAAAAIRALGTRAIVALIDGLGDPKTKDAAHALLREITKEDLPAERTKWLEWWSGNRH